MRSVLLLLALAACGKDSPEDTDPGEDTEVEGPCTDADNDGFCLEVDDCDDTSAIVHPGDIEIPYNGRDDNCDGVDVNDVDGDGVDGIGGGGDDCNDANPEIYPGAPEACYEGVDNNCDGNVILDDCDGDDYGKDVDCDEQDPAVNPGVEEIWYDGFDQDCDFDSDYDQDKDGDDSDAYGGGDCDDLDPTLSSLTIDRWDGIEGGCDGVLDSVSSSESWKTYNGSGVDVTWTSSLVVMNDYDGDGLPEIFAADLAKRDSDGDMFYGGGYLISTGLSEGLTVDVEICNFNGSGKSELFGWSADNLGDLDDDGYDDLVVGAPVYEEVGAALVFLGDDMRRGGTIASNTAHATLYGVDVNAGLMVANMGDLDDDGINDVAVGADINWYRQVAVYSGADVLAGGELTMTDALATSSEFTALGGAITGDVDIDADGMDDVLTGRTTPDYICGGACGSTSRVYVTPGDSFRGNVSLATDLFLKGPAESGLGQTIGFLDDVTGDGYPELVAADPLAAAEDGAAYGGVVYVVDGDELVDNTDIADIALWTMTAPTGNSFLRVPRHTADHDGDGVTDLMIGSPGQLDIYAALTETFATEGPGYVYYYEGDVIAAGGAATASDAAATFTSNLTESSFGMTLDVGEFSGEGGADLAVGAPLYGYGKLFLFASEL